LDHQLSRCFVKFFDKKNQRSDLKIALISLDQVWENKLANLTRCKELAAVAAQGGASLIIFPEMTLTGFTMNTDLSAEPTANSPSRAAFSSIASRHGLWVIAGIVLRQGSKAANTLMVFSPDGREAACYVKLHSFTHAGEDRWFEEGDSLVRVKIGEFVAGLSICYDLRFPEVFSSLSKDCDLLINIANWPQSRVSHWRILLQARATENQAYMIGVNRTGFDGNGLNYERSSCVVNPNGEFLHPVATFEVIDWYELSSQDLQNSRSIFSSLQDRRSDFYRKVI
jgi:predicted amidohydrolase